LKVAYAKEGATLFDRPRSRLELMTLKRAKIRGVDLLLHGVLRKELGISEDHEGIILLDADAAVGRPLADYMGDAVLDIDILPNMARNANVLGVARELAALTGRKLLRPRSKYRTSGMSIKPLVSIHIAEPGLNPRFVLGLIRDVHIVPSPYEVQRRLKLAGIRPINSIVDATNYAMLELGQHCMPLTSIPCKDVPAGNAFRSSPEPPRSRIAANAGRNPPGAHTTERARL